MNLGQLLLGQIGRRSEKKRSLAMLLTTSDLPGTGWSQIGQSGWRSGTGSVRGPVSRRAHKSGTFTALRRFRDEESRGLFIQVMPMPTSEDAESQVRQGRFALMSNRGVVRLEEQEVLGVDVPGVVSSVLWEHLNTRGNVRGYQRFIYERVDNIAILISGSASGDGWAWNDLVPIATAQAMKVQAHLAKEGSEKPIPDSED
jgi:hypothetical protein